MGIRLLHLHLHGLFRSHELELGRDADTGGQTLYVLELVRSLAQRAEVEQVDVVTRLIQDSLRSFRDEPSPARVGPVILVWINEQLEVDGLVTFSAGGWGDEQGSLVDVSDRL